MLTESTNIELRKHIQELEIELQLYKIVIDKLPMSILVKDAMDDFKYIICNKESEKKIGLKANEILGKTDYQLLKNKEDADLIRETDQFIIKSKVTKDIPDQNLIFTKTKTNINLQRIPVYEKNDHPLIILVGNENVTKTQLNIQSIIESNKKLNIIANHIPAYIGYINANSLKFEYVNQVYQKAFNKPLDKIIGKHVKDLIGEKNFQFAQKYIIEARAGNSGSYENTIEMSTGIRWINVHYVPCMDNSGIVKSIIVLTYDITSRKQAEKEIRAKEEQLQLIVNNLPALICKVDNNLNYSFSNNMHKEEFGYTSENIIGKNIAEVMGENAFENALPYIQRALNGEKVSFENTIINKNNEVINIQTYYIPYKTDDKIMGYFNLSLDISQIKHAEYIINQKNIELQKLNSDKNQFISILAHDLKNSFNGILGFLGILIANIRNYDINNIERLLKTVDRATQNTYILLENTLTWVRAQSGKLSFTPQKIDATLICEEIIFEMKSIAELKKISINYVSENQMFLFADSEMLKTILRNLLTNAIKYTNPNGKIIVQTKTDLKYATFSIIDNGVGIRPEIIKDIFNFSVKKSTKGTSNETGTGLGLVICNDFLELHHGKIWVESELGKGSTFFFTIPLNENQ